MILLVCFHLMILKKMIILFWIILKIDKVSSIEIIDGTNLTDRKKFRLNEISKIEKYFNQEIKERKLNNKNLSKY